MSDLPLVSCICPTFGRPPDNQSLLEEAIQSYLTQDYKGPSELIVLNDCPNQKLICNEPGVVVFNLPRRFKSLGQKYNAAIELANGSLICPWEDDDISLPWRISMSVERLKDRNYWSQKKFWYLDKRGYHYEHPNGVAHNCSIFTRNIFKKAQGYPHISGAQDLALDTEFQRLEPLVVGPVTVPEYFYIYRWGVSPTHLSGARKPNVFWDAVGTRDYEAGSYVLKPAFKQDYLGDTKKIIDPLLNPPAPVDTSKLKIFCLYHTQEMLDRVPDKPYLTKINLSAVDVGRYQDNRLGENRAFLSELDLGTAEYIGVLNARLNKKYKLRCGVTYENLLQRLAGKLRPDTVCVAWPAGSNWAAFSEKMHHGITPLLRELADAAGLRLRTTQSTLWANDFICHRDVWADWRMFWMRVFLYFHSKYGFDLPFPTYNVDQKRKPAYFYERLTSIYFANRIDLKMVELK